jgi:phage terminase large subunit
MSVINLNDTFPLSDKTGKRGPLPKQAEFMSKVLEQAGPKFVLYAAGVGSGKTLIGCITTLTLALLYPGDYLVCRQFMPELKLTTYKTFLEICPKELIAEHRIADSIVVIKSANGKTSNIIFRGLDEPDKHRSLNLNAAYIDEASQVSEEAFILLQSRIRGKHVRKIFMTTNVAGHDWLHNAFVKQDRWSESAKKLFYLVHTSSMENIHLPDGYIEGMKATWSKDKIKREIYAEWDSFAGMVYHEFRRDVHVIQPFQIPKDWTRAVGADHGYRNPSAWVWGAVDYDDNLYIYREFYEKEWLIEEICKGNKRLNLPGVLQLSKGEKLDQVRIDPSVRQTRGASGLSDWDVYKENLPDDFPLMLANNDKSVGIDRVKSFLKISPKTNKPRLYIFNTCTNLIDELSKYRYKELRHSQTGKVNDKEEPMKVNDHLCDSLRYLVMSRPAPPDVKDEKWNKLKYNSLEGAIARDMEKLKHPKNVSDPWE